MATQHRQALDPVLEKLTVEDLPGREHAVNYLQHKFRRNCKGCTLAGSGTAVPIYLAMLKAAHRNLCDFTRKILRHI